MTVGVWLDQGAWARAGQEGIRRQLDLWTSLNVKRIYPEVLYRGSSAVGGLAIPTQGCFSQWDVDPLEFLIQEAKLRELEVHAWVWVFCVGYYKKPGPAMAAHPDWVELDERGNRFSDWQYGTGWFSPSLPEVREYLLSTFEELVRRYPLDGLHLDYIRYNEEEIGSFGHSTASLARLKAETGLEKNQVLPGGEGYERFCQWRRDLITSFVREMKGRLPARVRLSAAVVPDPSRSFSSTMQDWASWVEESLLDHVATMAYTTDLDELKGLVGKALSVVSGKIPAYPGLGVWLNTPSALAQQMKLTRDQGALGLTLFAAAHMKEPYLRELSQALAKQE